MTPDTLLLRQIHPSFIQDGRVTSQAFRPTPKDEFLLSVDNGDRVSAESCWQRFIVNPGCKSIGVQAVSQAECTAQELPLIEDGEPHPEHCSIDYTAFDKKAIDKKSKLLRVHAETRGWLFREAVA
ncbi:MAG: hypothetical protein RBS05_06425 [Zoogloea oleivorans]|jgi:hypothetical protein|uniref:hypothetical protein n=1 Tax=Zoogloea oleivorans TaxID=1552750 RepID=UPI002A369089|nr:hypothetical protein [Zoogloea oleivorans]MDY0035529.1 hypothetical protein [Zoogloea oleivorans]